METKLEHAAAFAVNEASYEHLANAALGEIVTLGVSKD